ncbi:MAG: L,D-transpeptidase family protein [Desulfomonile tiedjei]|nr:L,D-transpeptidase family protein [Desulfomonile tiedjei]
MLLLNSQKSLPQAGLLAKILLPLTVCLTLFGSPAAECGEPLYPVALMNWMVEGSFHALIVDKSQQKLTVWKVKDGEPTMVESYKCSTGENDGDKWVRGDMRTPEGVYFFCSVIDGRTLPTKYGLWAFTTDYPNFVDRRRGKNGDGIWLHGRDKPLGPKPDSNGCIAVENQDLVKISRFVRLQSTPLIVVEKMLMAPRSRIVEQEREVRDFVERWRQSWETRDLDGYMSRYSTNFQSCWLDYNGWKEKKRKLNKRYSKIRVRLGAVYLYRQNGLITAIFTQNYSSDGFTSSGIKVLYLTHKGKYEIYVEDYHQPVDDPFPAGPLIARAGGQPGLGTDEGQDFRIRLVSTDEPENGSYEENETPRPSAPSKGVVLHRLAGATTNGESVPPLEVNEKSADGSFPERLIVASMVPAYSPVPEAVPERRRHVRQVVVAAEPVKPKPEASGPLTVKPGQMLDGKPATAEPTPLVASAPKESGEAASRPFGMEASAGDPQTLKVSEKEAVFGFLNKWKLAWEQKDLDRYVKMYHADFGQDKATYKTFLQTKKSFFRKYRQIRVEMDRVEIRKVQDQLVIRFVQTFRGDEYSDKGWKRMVLAGSKDKGFRILSEDWSPL